jgi:NAD(P)-dependent dehydrogenase (short-subunit alcohol dehydrogenase family)
MSRVLITGSAQGLGLLAGRQLIAADHEVVLHARNPTRARAASAAAPGASGVVVGDLASIEQTRQVAEQANASGRFDAVIHNAGVSLEPQRVETVDGLAHVFAVNVLAPYLLTALIDRPGRLVFLSSGMHLGGELDLDDLQWTRRRWNPSRAYAESKLLDVTLAFALARRWPEVPSNAVDPGWVSTRMGGPYASDDLDLGAQTQVWLATGDDSGATRTGRYLYHRRPYAAHPAASDPAVQDRLLAHLRRPHRETDAMTWSAKLAPWLSVADAGRAVDFYKSAFGAVKPERLEGDVGVLQVARLGIGEADFWVQFDPGGCGHTRRGFFPRPVQKQCSPLRARGARRSRLRCGRSL